jgi:hypothetical protein
MRQAHGPRRLKWALEWPVTITHSPPGDNNLSMSIPSVKVELVVVGGAIALGLLLTIFHSALGF